MAGRQKLVTEITVDSDDATRGLKKVGDAADKAAVDVDKLARELKSAQAPAKDFGRDADTMGNKVSDAMDNSKDSALGAASAMGEAFGQGGSATDAVGSFGEVVESIAESFGPFGPAVAAAGGLIIGMFAGAAQKAAELRERANEVFDALVDGAGALDEAFKKQQIQDFIKNNQELVTQVGALLGPGGLKDLGDAIGGNDTAYAALNKRVEVNLSQMKQQKHNLEALTLAGTPLTKQQQDQLANLNKQIPVYESLNGKIDDQASVINEARQAMSLYNGMTGTTTSSMGAYTSAVRGTIDPLKATIEWQRKATAGLYDTATAAQVAKNNVKWLSDALARRNARGTAPEGNASYIEGKGWVYNSGPNIGKLIPGRASGGTVSAGQAYTVGEYGKETFVPDRDGTIVPSGAMGGSVTVHQTIVTNDPVRVARDTARALRRTQFRGG